MPDWKDYDSRRTRPRLVVTLGADAHETLEGLAARRFGGNKSQAVEWAVLMADTVLAHPATITATEPQDALSAFTAAQGG